MNKKRQAVFEALGIGKKAVADNGRNVILVTKEEFEKYKNSLPLAAAFIDYDEIQAIMQLSNCNLVVIDAVQFDVVDDEITLGYVYDGGFKYVA